MQCLVVWKVRESQGIAFCQMSGNPVLAVADNLPYCNTPDLKDKVSHEWRQYQEEEISRDLFVSSEGQNEDGTAYVKYRRIDEYWYRMSTGIVSCKKRIQEVKQSTNLLLLL